LRLDRWLILSSSAPEIKKKMKVRAKRLRGGVDRQREKTDAELVKNEIKVETELVDFFLLCALSL